MGISIQDYRAAIGIYHCNSIKSCKYLRFPSNIFFSDGNHCFSYNLREWSMILTDLKFNRNVVKSKSLLSAVIATSLLIHMLMVLCNDVHPNPGPVNTLTEIKICHANVRSIKGNNRLFFVRNELAGKFDIITCSETWLCTEDKSNKFEIAGYQPLFRKDRAQGREPFGGVLAWVSNNVGCKRRSDFELDDVEAMWLEICTYNKKFFLCVAYRANSNTDNTYWDKLQENIDNIRALYNPKILICGDLNADLNTRQGKLMLDFVSANNFMYHITDPTRVTPTSNTILDQFISNFSIFKRDLDILPPLPLCDHSVISAKLIFKFKKPKAYKRTMWCFKDFDFDKYRKEIDKQNWENCFASDNIDTITEQITCNILKAAKATIPNREVTVRPSDKSWYTDDLRKLKRKMLRLFRKANSNKDPNDWVNFRETRKTYYGKVLEAKEKDTDDKYRYLSAEGKSNPKKWWSLLNMVYKNSENNDSIPPLEIDDTIITDDKDKAQAFNDFFTKASTLDDSGAEVPENPRPKLEYIDIILQDVVDQIKCTSVIFVTVQDLITLPY